LPPQAKTLTPGADAIFASARIPVMTIKPTPRPEGRKLTFRRSALKTGRRIPHDSCENPTIAGRAASRWLHYAHL
jgi:hypothetical protein